MKPHIAVFVFAAFLTEGIAHAQSTATSPEHQERGVSIQLRTDTSEQMKQKLEELYTALAKQLPPSSGAWWTNPTWIARLRLTEDQKLAMDRAFENRRTELELKTGLLQKEELQLARLLGADTIDRNAILTEVDRVIQARSELERTNASMILEMREHLTREQWEQIPQSRVTLKDIKIVPRGGANSPGANGAGGRGAPRGAGKP